MPEPSSAGSSSLLKSVEAFTLLSDHHREVILDACDLVRYATGDVIAKPRSADRSLYVLLSGRVRISEETNVDGALDTLTQGAVFGQNTVLFDEAPVYAATALEESTVLRLSKASYDAFLRRHPEAGDLIRGFISQSALRSFLSNSTVFSVLAPEEMAGMAKALQERRVRAGEVVIREGDPAREVFIIADGRFRVFSNADSGETLAVLHRGELVGETGVLNNVKRNANVVAEIPSTVYVLQGDVFLALLQHHRQLAFSIKDLVKLRAPAQSDAVEDPPLPENENPDALVWEEPEYHPPHGLRSRKRAAVRQQSQMDCGAACLTTVCLHYGKRISLNRTRDLARVGKAGASMLNLVRAARELGFEAIPFLATLEHLAKNRLPAVVNWNGYHWVVVHEVTDKDLLIADPAQGLIRLTKAQFLEGWTRYTIYLRPTQRFAALEPSPPTLEQFKPYLMPYKRLLFEIALASFTIQLFGLVLPVFTKFIIDDVVMRGDKRWLFSALVAMAGVIVLSQTLGFIRQQLLLFVSLRVNLRLLSDFYRHVLSLPLPFFERRKVGDIVTRFEENTKITRFFTVTGLEFFIDSFTAVLYLGLMFHYNVRLTLVGIGVLALHIVNLRYLTPLLQQGFRDAFQKSTESQSFTIESLTALRTIKVLGIERYVRWTWENLFIRYTNSYFTTIKYGVLSGLAGELVNHASAVAILFYGAAMVLRNQLSIGELVAFTVLTQNLTGPITKVVVAWDQLQETLNAVERLNDVYETTPESSARPTREKIALPTLRGNIRFDNVTFRYEPEAANVLQNLSLEIRQGQRVAFVGRSGSGKSTMAKLILGFYPPSSGSIFVDGFDLNAVWLPSVRQHIGVVPQDSFLFHGTIRDNICLARPDASMAAVERAAKLAGAHDFIVSFQEGYETVLQEGASNLSGGQRQRIAIARCILQKPNMLILDEATSALDNESERFFMRNLEEVFPSCTTIMIAHRLSTVRNCDLIVVLDHGNVIESGSHEQLLARKGMYYHLSTQQLNL